MKVHSAFSCWACVYQPAGCMPAREPARAGRIAMRSDAALCAAREVGWYFENANTLTDEEGNELSMMRESPGMLRWAYNEAWCRKLAAEIKQGEVAAGGAMQDRE